MNNRNIVGWFEIYVQEMNRAKKFYQSVFNVQLTKLPAGIEMWAFPINSEAPGCPGALVHMPGVESKMGGTIVYFHSPDCAHEQELAAQNGGQVFKPKFSIGEYGYISLVQDTEGNLIGSTPTNSAYRGIFAGKLFAGLDIEAVIPRTIFASCCAEPPFEAHPADEPNTTAKPTAAKTFLN